MFETLKKFLLPFLLVVFLLVIFLDQNNNPVPVKVILGPPVHLSLSLIIAISMTVGALLAIGLLLLIKALTHRNGKDELTSEKIQDVT